MDHGSARTLTRAQRLAFEHLFQHLRPVPVISVIPVMPETQKPNYLTVWVHTLDRHHTLNYLLFRPITWIISTLSVISHTLGSLKVDYYAKKIISDKNVFFLLLILVILSFSYFIDFTDFY